MDKPGYLAQISLIYLAAFKLGKVKFGRARLSSIMHLRMSINLPFRPYVTNLKRADVKNFDEILISTICCHPQVIYQKYLNLMRAGWTSKAKTSYFKGKVAAKANFLPFCRPAQFDSQLPWNTFRDTQK